MYKLSPLMESSGNGSEAHRHVPSSPASHSTQVYTPHAAMSPSTPPQKADSPTLKRAHTTPNSSFPCKKLEQTFGARPNRPSTTPPAQRRPNSPTSRYPRLASPIRTRRPSMVQTSASFMPMPSFGAVFGGDHHNSGPQHHAAVNGSNVARPASSGNTTTGTSFASFHIHSDSRDSTSTASSDNSPTTTISTMDSSSVTDPSPASPESPLAKTVAPSSFSADFRSRRSEPHSADSSPSTFFELARPTTPAKKPRNLKNLGINTASSLSNLRAQTPAPAVVPKEKNSSAPPSPLFIKPPTPPKRRPSNLSLTISTPGSTDNKPMKLMIPSTPSFNRPALRHFQSSPSLPSVNTLGGGMKFPPLRPLATNRSGLSEVPFEMEEEEDQEQNFDIPQSREEKPAAYPNGPICIYEVGVYLYFEPTAEQATTFDCIINVASEVQNPFLSPATDSQKDIDARRIDGPPAENVDFGSLSQRVIPAFKTKDSSPTTPKATPKMNIRPAGDILLDGKTYRMPEYIHMPWEHNTDIVRDLHTLVQMMDERVQKGQRILIHCQCGVSRSASLIVAYGLYKNPEMAVQEAYDQAKKRSRWIGPNMNLIMQLQEFRNSLLRQNESRSYHNQGYGRRPAGSSTARSIGTNRHSPFDQDVPSGSRTPQTAPLPPDSDISMQRASTGNIMAISPGPLSAPTGMFAPGFRRSWDSSQTHFDLPSQATPTSTPYIDPNGHLVPTLSLPNHDQSSIQLKTPPSEIPRLQQETTLTLPQPYVPNFSRQLPFRSQDPSFGEWASPSTEKSLLAPVQSLGFGALKSPAVGTFTVPTYSPYSPQQQPYEPEIMSPIKTSFDNPWPQGYDAEPQPSIQPSTFGFQRQEFSAPPPLLSPRATEFHMTGLNNESFDGSFGMLSPRATSFELSRPALSHTSNRSSESYEIASPTTTQFPKDIFGKSDDALDDGFKSPRATEFHMTPLKPVLADEDPYGLTSPTRAEFPGSSCDIPTLAAIKAAETESRRTSFQAILPPQHQTFNGFTSLDGAAQAQPISQAPVSMSNTSTLMEPEVDSPTIRLEAPPRMHVEAPIKTSLPSLEVLPVAPETPRTPDHAFLSTPAKGIRTRFSSPNLREQRKLHKLQTEIKSKLPKPSIAQHAADDIDALLSPRAEEFTRNPFHFDLRANGDDTSPASSNETIKDGRNGHSWDEPKQWTPEKATVDPRSPVQTGGSPIVRNIWDVL